jgi:hypothetical protein
MKKFRTPIAAGQSEASEVDRGRERRDALAVASDRGWVRVSLRRAAAFADGRAAGRLRGAGGAHAERLRRAAATSAVRRLRPGSSARLGDQPTYRRATTRS